MLATVRQQFEMKLVIGLNDRSNKFSRIIQAPERYNVST